MKYAQLKSKYGFTSISAGLYIIPRNSEKGLPLIDYPSRTLFGYGYNVSSSLVEPEDTAAGGSPVPTLPRVIIGDFSQGVTLCDFGVVDVAIDAYSAAESGQVKLNVTSYYDVAVTNATAFSVYSKAATTP